MRHHQVDPRLRFTQPVIQRRDVGVQATEDKPLVAFQPGNLTQVEGAFVCVGLLVLDSDTAAVTFIAPAMEATRQCLCVAVTKRRQNCSTVRTCVDEAFERSVLLTVHKNRLLADFCPEIVSVRLNLVFMAEEHPAFLEDLVDLLLEERLIRIDGPVDPKHALVHSVVDQCRHVFRDDTTVHSGLLKTLKPYPASGGRNCNRGFHDPSLNYSSPG